jgi:opacity protein-like surface antigen
MKKKLFFNTLVAIVFSNIGMSQIKFGVKGGLNLTDLEQGINIKGTVYSETFFANTNGTGTTQSSSQTSTEEINQTLYVATSPKISFYLGGFAEMPMNKKGNLSLRTELLFCRNGANFDKKEAPPTNVEGTFYTSSGGSYSINELNLPVLLKFTTNKKVSFLAGCYFGTILTAQATNSQGLGFDIKSSLKTFDFGLNLGASYQINKNWSVEVRHNRGLFNKDKTSEKDLFFDIQGLLYSRTLHVGVDYQF